MKVSKFILKLSSCIVAFCAYTLQSKAVVWYPMPTEAYTFGKKYPDAQRLLFAFDYGHALVYERLLNTKGNVGEHV